jgi:hypothetical protein
LIDINKLKSVQQSYCLGISARPTGDQLILSLRPAKWPLSLLQPRKNPTRDTNLIMIPYSIVELDPNSSAFVRVANAVVIDLEGIDGLDQICLFTLDVDYVAQFDRTVGQFDDSDIYSRIIVNNTPDERFSYANSHN